MDTIRPVRVVVCDAAGCYGRQMLRPEVVCVAALAVMACPGPEVTCPTPMIIDRAMDRCVCPEGMEATEDGWSCMSLDAGEMDGGMDGGSVVDAGELDGGVDAQVDVDGGASCDDTCVWGCSPDCDPPVSISSRTVHVCVSRESGAAVCWGWNDFGQLGSAPSDPVGQPQEVSVLGLEASTGRDHSCVRSTDGSVSCWGGNFAGQLGNGTDEIRFVPRAVVGVSDVIDIASGATHSCVARVDRTVACWGSNDSGQLGVPPLESVRSDARTVVGLTDVVEVVAGLGHTCALREGGEVYCWGDNRKGQLGDASFTRRTTPVQVRNLPDAQRIFAGAEHTCAIRASGELWCWGNNENGQLADGSQTNRSTPVHSDSSRTFADGAAGQGFTCAVDVGGGLWCWGDNSAGQLGRGTRNDVVNPPALVDIPRPTQLAAGDAHVCAITVAGVFCWGSNETGQIGNGGLGGLITVPTETRAP